MEKKRRVATVGTFDGVHSGHRSVVATLKSYAEAHGLEPLVVTFDRHPLEIVAPERAPGRIISLPEEIRLLQELGTEVAIEVFNEDTRRLTARQWIEIMHSRYGVEALVVGYDNTFGCDGVSLSVADYRQLGASEGVDVVTAPVVPNVSSSEIRRLLHEGDTVIPARLMGRPFRLEGEVVHGRELGRRLGFPTVNLQVASDRLVPAGGVYAAMALLPDGKRYPAVVNIGVRPTVGTGLAPTIEAHIIGWSGELYGKHIGLEFCRRIRGERRFDTLDDLKNQIAEDCRAAERIDKKI